jgi:hypothetical protein
VNTSKTYKESARELPVYGSYDVIVVGGGCAGLAAAIASARNGAKTLIIERFPYFGGTATASLMASANGFRNQVEPDGLQTSRGIAEEVILKIKEAGGLGRKPGYKQREYPMTPGQLPFSVPFDTETFKYVTLKMVVESGADILFHTWFADVIKEGNRVTGIVFENKSGRQAAFAEVVIDASGDADVAFKAGASYWQTKKDEASRLVDCLMYRVAGYESSEDAHGCEANGAMALWGPKADPGNGVDADELTREEIKARLAVFDDLEEQKERSPGLKGAHIVETPPLIGVRQTRFIEGEYKLTAEDVLRGARFDDAIAMASKPIIHYYGYRRYLEHEGYEVPFRCLQPKGLSHILVAGRCMSADQPAFESVRSESPSMCVGQAAGTAAAMAAQKAVAPTELNIKELQAKLIEQGAEIGQNRTHDPIPLETTARPPSNG